MADAFSASPAAAAAAAATRALADSPRVLPPPKYSPPYWLQVCVTVFDVFCVRGTLRVRVRAWRGDATQCPHTPVTPRAPVSHHPPTSPPNRQSPNHPTAN
jgi:hypothetical protein